MTTYSSSLTVRSSTFCLVDPCVAAYYYEAVLLNVTASGLYTISSQSNMDTYGYVYSPTFDPRYMGFNVIGEDDQNGGNDQFSISLTLQAGGSYIVVLDHI